MSTINRLELLQQQYSDLTREFILALKNNQSSADLEDIRAQIKNILSEMEALQADANNQKENK